MAELPGRTAEAEPALVPVTLPERVAETIQNPAVEPERDAAQQAAMVPVIRQEQAENQALVEAQAPDRLPVLVPAMALPERGREMAPQPVSRSPAAFPDATAPR